jgi:cell division protease FtsH
MIYGMSDVAGLMVLEKQTNRFLGGGFGQSREYSEKMQEEIDNFVKEMLAERYQHVKNILRKYAQVIEQMVKELYEKEVIEGKRVRELIAEFDNKKEGEDEENRNNS